MFLVAAAPWSSQGGTRPADWLGVPSVTEGHGRKAERCYQNKPGLDTDLEGLTGYIKQSVDLLEIQTTLSGKNRKVLVVLKIQVKADVEQRRSKDKQERNESKGRHSLQEQLR